MKAWLLAVPVILAGALAAQNTNQPNRIQREVNALTRFLNLDSGQQAQVTTILANEQSTIQGLETTLRSDRTNLIAAIKNNDTGSINSITSMMAPLQAQVDAARATAAAQIYALLGPDQKTKLGNGIGMLLGGFGGRGPGPGFRGGPPPAPPQQ